MFRRSLAVVAVSILAATSLAAASQDKKVSQPATRAPQGSEIQVGVDEHGQIRPLTQEEQRVLSLFSAPRPQSRLETNVHASGMVSIALDETYDHAFSAHLSDSGELVFECAADGGSHYSAAVLANPIVETIIRLRTIQNAPRPAERQ
jgi:hypothetical protein